MKTVDSIKEVSPSLILSLKHSLDEKQLATLDQFKAYLNENELSSSIFDDWFLLRFLRARKFDFKKALKMFLDYLKYREDNQVGNILDRDWTFVSSTYVTMGGGYWQVDKQGRPYLYMQTHGFDADTYASIEFEHHVKYEIWFNEHLIHSTFPYLSKKLNKRVDKLVII